MAAAQTEAALKVGAKSYAASELLKRREIESITVKHDSAYGGREMHYQAIGVVVRDDRAALDGDCAIVAHRQSVEQARAEENL